MSTKRSSKLSAALTLPAQDHTNSIADRTEKGKALRKACSRKAQASWEPPANRADPVELLVENSRGRLETASGPQPELADLSELRERRHILAGPPSA